MAKGIGSMAAATSSAWAWSSTNCWSGRRPFRADSQAELLEQITSYEPRPPRQYDDSIPKELERICLKALSKRASERYIDGQGHGRRPAALSGRADRQPAARTCNGPRRAFDHAGLAAAIHGTRVSIGHDHDADLGPASPSRSCRRACGRSTPTMPTSSSNCCPALVTGTDCPTASGSGRPGSRKRTPTTRSRWA